MTLDTNNTDIKPWYKQFWPWFLIALPGSVVIASLYTVNLAFKYEDPLVQDNYYKVGLAINRRFELSDNAKAKKLTGKLSIDDLTGEVLLDLSAADKSTLPQSLTLQLTHPVDVKKDLLLILKQATSGRYIAQMPDNRKHKWHAQLFDQDPDQAQWVLNGELNLRNSHQAILAPKVD